MDIIIRHKDFKSYGLDASKNCLEAPVCCNSKCSLGLPENLDDFWEGLYQLLAELSFEQNIEKSAIFAHALDGSMKAFIKIGNGEEQKCFTANKKDNLMLFNNLAEAYNLDGYALIIQQNKEEWEVIEE